jgi:hypothetical protein
MTAPDDKRALSAEYEPLTAEELARVSHQVGGVDHRNTRAGARDTMVCARIVVIEHAALKDEPNAALRDLAEAREQLATMTAFRDQALADREASDGLLRDYVAQLTACRRERDDAQKASMAPLLLRLAVAPRFWTKVNLNGPVPPHKPRLGKCWIWTASTSSGYGKFKAGYKWHRAHRFSYECATGTVIATGDDPQDTSVMHLCDNTLCVNPRHLALGTHLDNVRDCVKKGRNRPYRGGPFAGKKAANE